MANHDTDYFNKIPKALLIIIIKNHVQLRSTYFEKSLSELVIGTEFAIFVIIQWCLYVSLLTALEMYWYARYGHPPNTPQSALPLYIRLNYIVTMISTDLVVSCDPSQSTSCSVDSEISLFPFSAHCPSILAQVLMWANFMLRYFLLMAYLNAQQEPTVPVS